MIEAYEKYKHLFPQIEEEMADLAREAEKKEESGYEQSDEDKN